MNETGSCPNLAAVEEVDVSSGTARNRMKDWVVNDDIAIRKMHTQTYRQRNTLHFIQCSNDRSNCPVGFGDTRVTMLYVPEFRERPEIPKQALMVNLSREAPHFMRTLVDLDVPEPEGRLRIPPITTASKERAMEIAEPDLAAADAMADPLRQLIQHGSWQGTAKELADRLGEGMWPSSDNGEALGRFLKKSKRRCTCGEWVPVRSKNCPCCNEPFRKLKKSKAVNAKPSKKRTARSTSASHLKAKRGTNAPPAQALEQLPAHYRKEGIQQAINALQQFLK